MKIHGNTKHGEAVNGYSKLYVKWHSMISRVSNKNDKYYSNYGGRGITVCDEWRISAMFFIWAKSHGYREGLEIDRRDNNGNYCPENCHFVTHGINQINKRKRDNFCIYPRHGKYRVVVRRFGYTYRRTVITIEEALLVREKYINEIDLLIQR